MEKYFYDEQGRLNMRFIATPFEGVIDGQDFKGTHFSKRTDFGPLEKALSYLDHNNLSNHHPELKSLPGITDRLGVAVREGLSENEELIYRIIIDESYRYKEMLKALADAGALDYASTTPYQKHYEVNRSTGEILSWPIIEVGPTWKPAHPGAANVSGEEIVKSIIMKELEMAKETQVEPVVEEAASTEVQAVTASETPVTDAVNALLEDGNSTEKSVPQLLTDMIAQFAALSAKVDGIVTAQAAQEKSLAAIDKVQKDLSVAVPKLGEVIAKNLSTKIADDKGRSHVEKSVVKDFQQQAARNANAPGRDRKASFAANN